MAQIITLTAIHLCSSIDLFFVDCLLILAIFEKSAERYRKKFHIKEITSPFDGLSSHKIDKEQVTITFPLVTKKVQQFNDRCVCVLMLMLLFKGVVLSNNKHFGTAQLWFQPDFIGSRLINMNRNVFVLGANLIRNFIGHSKRYIYVIAFHFKWQQKVHRRTQPIWNQQ